MKQSKTGRIPAWVLSHLKRYGNCAIGRKVAKELGDELLPLLQEEGYVCEFLTIDHSGEGKSGTTYVGMTYWPQMISTSYMMFAASGITSSGMISHHMISDTSYHVLREIGHDDPAVRIRTRK